MNYDNLSQDSFSVFLFFVGHKTNEKKYIYSITFPHVHSSGQHIFRDFVLTNDILYAIQFLKYFHNA